MHSRQEVVAAGLLFVLSASCAFGAPGDIINLGTLGEPQSYGAGINNHGVATGYSITTGNLAYRPFKHPGTAGAPMQDLGTLGGNSSYGYDINDAGAVVGLSYLDNIAAIGHAFKHPGAVGAEMQDLGTFGGTHSTAFAINNAGAVAGFATTLTTPPNQVFRAFVHPGTTDGSLRDLGTLGGTSSAAYDINDAGAVVGRANIVGNATYRAFKHPGGLGDAMQDLGTLGGTSSTGRGINSAGVVVGFSLLPGDNYGHAFRHPGTAGAEMQDLGSLGAEGMESSAFDINTAGAAVGASVIDEFGTRVATLWTSDNEPIDLDAWLDAINPALGAHWQISDASSINDSGLICGTGYFNDGSGLPESGPRAYVLDASSLIPEPSASALYTVLLVFAPRRRQTGNGNGASWGWKR